jgi:hypothetical protein
MGRNSRVGMRGRRLCSPLAAPRAQRLAHWRVLQATDLNFVRSRLEGLPPECAEASTEIAAVPEEGFGTWILQRDS